MGTSYMLHKDSLGYLFSSIFGAAVNVSLNLLLIPQWGIHGAAFATGLSFFGMFLFRLYHTGKYLRYRIFSGEFISGCAVMITVSLLAYTDGYAGLAVQLLLLLFYAAAKGFFGQQESRFINKVCDCFHSITNFRAYIIY